MTTSAAPSSSSSVSRLLDAEIAEPLAPDERVVGDDAHPEAERAACDLLADAPEADHAERLSGELDAAPARALPAALLERGVRLRDVARERDDQADRLLRRRDDRRLGRVRDDDPSPGRRVDVDVVDPDPGPADHLEPARALDHLAGQPVAERITIAVVAVDDLLERRVGVDVDVEAAAQELDPRVGDRLADEDAHLRPLRDGAERLERRRRRTSRLDLGPGCAELLSTAVSAPATSSIVTWPMWPMRKRRGTSSPCPPAIVIPCRSRSARRSATASMPSGVSAPVSTAALSSSGE